MYFNPPYPTPPYPTIRHIRHHFVGPFRCFSFINQPPYPTIKFQSAFQINLEGISGYQHTFDIFKDKHIAKSRTLSYAFYCLTSETRGNNTYPEWYKHKKCRIWRSVVKKISDNPDSAISDNMSDIADSGSSDIRHIRHVLVGPLKCRIWRTELYIQCGKE